MSNPIDSPNSPKSGWRERLKRVGDWLEYKDKKKWVKDMKGSLGLTASIIATMTFQLATNPPGGVIQASLSDLSGKPHCSKSNGTRMCVGEAVLGVIQKNTYLAFLTCNTISFVASLGVCLLLVSGIPIEQPFVIWLLSAGMSVTVTFLSLTYLFAAYMVTPSSIWASLADNVLGIVLIVWVSLAVIVGAFQIGRFFVRRVIKWTL